MPQWAIPLPFSFTPHDGWPKHFQMEGAFVLGKTAIGRVTVQVLGMNAPDQLAIREQLLQEGWVGELMTNCDGILAQGRQNET